MSLFSGKISVREMAIISRQLATAYNAGIPVIRTLEMTAEQKCSQRARRALLGMVASIRAGSTLTDAAGGQQEFFPEFFVEVLSAGETGGRLDLLLRDLADHYENMYRMERSILVSMVYPSLQLLSAWFLGTFALGIIRGIGSFQTTTAKRFSLSGYFNDYLKFQGIAITLAVLAVALLIALGRAGLLAGIASFVKNKLWPINKVAHKYAMARFYRSMALLVHAGVDIKRCIERSAAMTMNRQLERDLLLSLPVISQGGTLEQAFSRCRSIGRVGKEMIAVGEQTGNLDAALNKAAQYNFEEAQSATKAAVSIAQVLITIIVGGIVAYFVISFYGNLYGQAFQNL